jgi:hypothetical protein
MNATKAMIKMLTGDIKMLSEFVSKFELQVEMFAVLNFSSTSEIAIVDFVKMSNFLITEYEFLYNGKDVSEKRTNKSYDFLNGRLTSLEQIETKKQNTLDNLDNQLKLISYKLHGCIQKIRHQINVFKTSFAYLPGLSLNYSKYEIASDISNFSATSLTYGSKIYDITSMMSGFDYDTTINTHAWYDKKLVSKKRKISRTETPNQNAKKKSNFKVSNVQLDTKMHQDNSNEQFDTKMHQNNYSNEKLDKKNSFEQLATKMQQNNSINKQLDAKNPIEKLETKSQKRVEVKKSSTKKFIAEYNFSNTDILVKTSFQDNEKMLAIAASQLFHDAKCNEERQRSFIFHILSIYAEMRISFQEFFLLLERTIQKLKDTEMDRVREDGLTNKTEKNSLRDSLQRRARKFVSSYGKMIFDFLREYKSCQTNLEKAILLNRFWPMSELTDEGLEAISTLITETVDMLYAEDQLLVCLSVEGFQSFRNDLYSAIQDETVSQLYLLNQKENCLLRIQSLVSSTTVASFKKPSFLNNLWNYVGEYQSSILPKAESRRIPWELRKLKTNSLEETDSKTSTTKKRSKTSISKTCDDKEAIMSKASCAVEDIIEETEDPQKKTEDPTVTTTDLACDADSDYDPVSTNNGLTCLKSQDTRNKRSDTTNDFAGDEGTSSLQNNVADGTTQINISEIIVEEDVNIATTSAGEDAKKAIKYDSCDDFGDDIEDCELLDETDFQSRPSDDTASLNEVLVALLNHLSIEEIWENIDDLWENIDVQDLKSADLNTVTPAPKNTHQGSEAISDLQQTCYRMQLSSLSPNQMQIQSSTTAICTPNENGVNNFQAAIDHLAKEFCNDWKDSQSFSYSFFCNLQNDLDSAAATNNLEDFFSTNEYLEFLTFGDNWKKKNIFHCILNCESEYVLVYMDSHSNMDSFCLQIWASQMSSGNGTIQLFVDNFRNMLQVIGSTRKLEVLQNVFPETDRSDVCSFMTLLCHLFCIREGISKRNFILSESKRNTLKNMVDTDKLPSIDAFLDVVKPLFSIVGASSKVTSIVFSYIDPFVFFSVAINVTHVIEDEHAYISRKN